MLCFFQLLWRLTLPIITPVSALALRLTLLCVLLFMLGCGVAFGNVKANAKFMPKEQTKAVSAADKKHIEAEAKSEKTLPTFEVKTGPPPGFETLALKQTEATFVSVYFNGRLLANVTATFNDRTIRFKTPHVLAKKIPQLKPSAIPLIEKKLALSLDNNRVRLCHGAHLPFVCKPPHPKVLSVVFSPLEFKAVLYINPDYLDIDAKKPFNILGSTSGFSYLANNSIYTSGTLGANYRNTATLSTTNVIANNNHAITLNTALTRVSQKRASATNHMDLSTFSYSTLLAEKKLSAGVIQTAASGFIPSKYLLGLSITNNGFFIDPDTDVGTLIPFYLNSDAKVDVYRGQSLLSSNYYPAGKHYLVTTALPEGAYNIHVVITSQTGEVTTFDHFFVKLPGLPVLGETNYHADFGVLEDNSFQNNDSTTSVSYPHFTNTPLFDVNVLRRITENVGLGTLFQSNFHDLATSVDFRVQYSELILNAGLVVGTENTYGVSSNASYFYKGIHLGINARKIFSHQAQRIHFINNQDALLVFNAGANYGLTLGTSLGGVSMSFGTSLQQSANRETQVLYDTNVIKTFNVFGGTLTSMMMAGHTNDSSSVSLSMTYNFTVPTLHELSGSLSVSGQKQKRNTKKVTTTSNVGLNVHKNWRLGLNGELNNGFSYAEDQRSQTMGLSMSYFHYNANRGALSVRDTRPIGRVSEGGVHNISYSGNTQFSFVKAADDVTFTPDMSYTTAVLVDVKAPKPVQYQVYVDRRRAATGYANHASLVYVSPYLPHTVSIVQTGEGLYHYDKTLRNVNLYEGNVQALDWVLAKQYILFAQIVDEHHHGLNDLLVEGMPSFTQTGTDGYLQLDLTEDIKTLSFRSIDNTFCQVVLPPNRVIKDGLSILDEPLVCALHPPKNVASKSKA